MKISIDGTDVLELNETKKKVLGNDIPMNTLDEDLKRRVQWVITHKYDQCMKRLRDEWMPKLQAKGLKTVPLDDDAFSELVFSQPEYKSRSQRDS